MAAPVGCCTPAVLKVNLSGFKAGFELWMKRRNEKAIARYKAFGRNLFNDIVMRTPEYTGGTAASWKFGVGAVSNGKATYFLFPDKPYTSAKAKYANPQALEVAFAEVITQVEKIKSLNQAIFISNPAKFERDDGPENKSSKYVAKAMEDPGNDWLRAVNRPGDSVREAVSYAKTFNWYRGGGLIHEF